MARNIKPGDPNEIKATVRDVKMPSWEAFDKLGDAEIKAANANFKLYADNLLKSEAAKLYNEFSDDPIQLSNGLAKLPDMLKGIPQELQDEMIQKSYLQGVALVQKAQNNQRVKQDLQNKQMTDSGIVESKGLLSQVYQNVLQNHISKAEDKNFVANDIFLQEVNNLNSLSELTTFNGKSAYTDTQKKAIRNIDNLELDGFKQFFDTMITNDNDDLQATKDYYTKFILAPERFMSENYMNRDTYDKVRAYAEKQLKQAGADIKKARFNQSIKEATELQVADLPGQLNSLRESGLIDSRILDNIEKTNVKFNNIDPSKAEMPIAMINMLQILNNERLNNAPRTEAEQQEILEKGTAALDSIAEYAQEYGLSPENVQRARETVVNLEQNLAFRPVLDNFRDIVDNFDSKLASVRRRATMKGGFSDVIRNITLWDGMSHQEEQKMIALNNALAIATDTINQQIRNGDWAGVRQTQREFQKTAGRLKNDWVDWQEADNNKDAVFLRNGQYVKPLNFTEDGDYVFDIVK